VHPSNTWFSSLSGATEQPPNRAPAPIAGHDFGHADAYSIDNLFLDQISSSYGCLSAQQMHHSAGHGGGNQTPANDLHAFMGGSVAGGVEPPMMRTTGMLDVDPDTIAMWSSAPTGFGWVF